MLRKKESPRGRGIIRNLRNYLVTINQTIYILKNSIRIQVKVSEIFILLKVSIAIKYAMVKLNIPGHQYHFLFFHSSLSAICWSSEQLIHFSWVINTINNLGYKTFPQMSWWRNLELELINWEIEWW